ncbi:DUF6153 family protein [Allonocardiopsis opalescens]|uniref:DUF6153 family protein n=1 Tax=Allonocardiopsis opalescens TaxID=1144618 RepID=UPI000D06DB7D|nr:DUF6153 family protein [Allonocardiopsis opalescens]
MTTRQPGLHRRAVLFARAALLLCLVVGTIAMHSSGHNDHHPVGHAHSAAAHAHAHPAGTVGDSDPTPCPSECHHSSGPLAGAMVMCLAVVALAGVALGFALLRRALAPLAAPPPPHRPRERARPVRPPGAPSLAQLQVLRV